MKLMIREYIAVYILLGICVSIHAHADSSGMGFFTEQNQAGLVSRRSNLRSSSLPYGVTQVSVNVDIFVLEAGDEVVLNLPISENLTIVYDHIIQHESGNKTWVGHLLGHPAHRVILTGSGVVYDGRITIPGNTFSIQFENGITTLLDHELAGLQHPPFGNDGLVPPEPKLQRPHVTELLSGQQQLPPIQAASSSNVIDLMIVYSPGIASDYPGSTLQVKIDQMTAVANQAFSDSSIATTLRIVKIQAVAFVDTGANSPALDLLTKNTGVFAGIAATRDSVGADLVIFLRKFADDSVSCGVAWTFQSGDVSNPAVFRDGWSEYPHGYAFGVVSLGLLPSGFFCTDGTYSHEIGHIMGSAHDYKRSAGGGDAFPYAIGHYSDSVFGTIMSYESGRVLYFSNPDLIMCGSPFEACGVAVGATGEADNRTAFAATNPILAAFRATVTIPDADNDGVPDADDAFPTISLGGRTDTDGDGAPDDCDQLCLDAGMAADTDDDGDGVLDGNDLYPLISLGGREDTDGDGAPNVCDQACLDAGMAADTDTANFVSRFYLEVLGRPADSAGLADWVSKLQTTEKTGADIAYGFIFSQEFINRELNDSDYLDVLYRAFFNRVLNNTDFVNTLYRAFFGREPDTAGSDGWIAQFSMGTSRQTVLNGFIGAQEFINLANSYGITAQ